MKNRKRWISMALAGVMILQTNGILVLAETASADVQTAAVQEAVETEIGSEIWNTPVIPDAAKYIKGIDQTEVTLNETTGDGTWRYLFDIPDYTQAGGIAAPNEENQDFDFSKWEERDWKNIKVPGEPLMQGFDILTNNEYYYQREITVPEDFAGNRVLVRFDGVYSNSRVWINGKYIRTHVGGFTTWDCDITEYAAPGETVTMTVGVAELYSTTKGIWNPEGKSVNNPANATEYAHHNMGGINRDVSLVAVPYDSIARIYVNTDFDESFTNADLEVTAQLNMVSGEGSLLVELLDGESVVTSGEIDFDRETETLKNLPQLVEEASTLLKENETNLYEGNTGKKGQYSKAAFENMRRERDNALKVLAGTGELSAAKKLTLPVTEPKQWDAEHPNLYTLRTTLLVNGEAVQINEEKVGFREIHYGGADGTDTNKVYVNGKEVKLRGTCRHDVSDDLGRSMTREESYAEIAAYKNANINHIRTSHYPASEDLLDACDEMGIYVEQETAVCFQGPWADVSSKYEDFLPQFTEMIERDRNRPSILIWSLGNESNYSKVASQSGGNAFQDEREYLRDVDTTRPCVFSFPDTGEPAGFADIYSAHYASVTGGMGRSDKPVIHDEYAHISCYNLDELQRDVNVRNFWGESVKKGWENIFTSDGALGGALWGGIDDVFYIPEGTTERWQSHSDGQTAGYGEWGSVLDAYLREKPEAYLTKKAYSPVRIEEEACYISDGTMYIPVKNWFDHTDTNELKLEYTVDGEQQEIMVGESIAPHSDGVITINGVSQNAETVNLKFYTPDGIMVDEYNVAITSKQYNFTPAGDQAPAIENSEKEIVVKGEEFSVSFSKESGMILSGQFQDKVLVTGGPYLHVTGMSLGEWNLAETDGITAEIQEQYAVVTVNGSYANGQGVRFDIKISGNGIITTDYTLTTAPKVTSGLKEVGISYDIDKDTDSVSWFRDGLYTAYPEDHIGRNQGVALKVRKGADETPDQYGVEPQWSWKDDMKNYFVYSTDDPNNGLVTNDFKTMREHVWSYDVNYGLDADSPRISVESPDAGVAARVALTYDLGYVDDRDAAVKYTGSWAPYDSNSDYAGTETYSSKLGDTCEFTFTGTGVRYIGSKQKNTGLVKLYVDGIFKEEIDTYSNLGSDLKQAVIYSIEGLDNGEHTIKLETAGGKANCIVVDAFEVLKPEGSNATEKAQLIINNQWYYPNLGWGNYTGIQGKLSNGSTGSGTIRLSNENNMTEETITSLGNVRISEINDQELKVSYYVQNPDEATEVKLQWYRVAAGDPDSKAQAIEGAQNETLNIKGLEANKVYCSAVLIIDGKERQTVKSNGIEIGQDSYRYYDILDDSDEFVFTGTQGTDYKTDKDKSWTANAYGKSVTYLMDTENEAGISFQFAGSGIRWVGAKEDNQGIAAVAIDGGTPVEIDLYDADSTTGSQVNEVLFEQVWNEPGEHTITIFRTGRKNESSLAANISLDAFIVINDLSEDVRISNVAVSANEDGSLTADCTITNGTPEDLQYQWYAADAYSAQGYDKETYEAIEGAVGKDYIPADADAGKLLRCDVWSADADTPVRSANAVLAKALMIDDTDESVQYPEGSIQDTADAPYLAGNKPYNNTITYFKDGDVTLHFDGTGIVWLSGYDQTPRSAAVKIDDGSAEPVEIRAAQGGGWDFNQYKVYEVTGLEPGEHSITITAGTPEAYNNVDAFMVLNPGTEQPQGRSISADMQEPKMQTEIESESEANDGEDKTETDNTVMTQTGTVRNTVMALTGIVNKTDSKENGKSVMTQTGTINKSVSEDIDNAIVKLTKAISDFKASRIEKEPVDKSKLSALINSVNGKYNEKLYTPESWKVFIQALNAAKGVNTNENAVQADVTKAISALEAGIRGLKPVEAKPVPVDKTALKNLYQSCASLKKSDYTASTWSVLEAAMKNAAAVINNPNATKEMTDQAYNALNKAKGGISKIPALPKKGSTYQTRGLRYKVTASTSRTKTVMLVKPAKKTYRSITIPSTVKIKGYTYKVTRIADNAFRKNTRLWKVTIGSNVTKIGKESFAGCKKLRSVTLKSKSITSIGKYAFKNISSKAKIYVPKKKYSSYKRLLSKSKLSSKVKIIKKTM